MGIIFDLDQTLIDTRIAEHLRKSRDWPKVYSLISSFVLYDGISELFHWVEVNNIPTCVVTKSPSPYCIKVLSYWGLPYFHMVCFHDCRNQKPHPEPMQLALIKLGLDSSQVLSLGDTRDDIVSSTLAGISSIACLWGAEDRDSLIASMPTYISQTPKEALRLLGEFKKQRECA